MELLKESALKLLGLELTASQLELFQLYYEELVAWNERVNLTAITGYEEAQIRHFLDSLTLASPTLRGEKASKPLDMTTASLIDIGAGAGFPGVPLKIVFPGMKIALVDSVGKKTTFLTHLVEKLELQNVSVITGRAEELGRMPQHRGQYSIATGRAVASLPVLAEYCLPLCKKDGGLFIAPKKGDISPEVKMGTEAVRLLGARMRRTPVFDLPGEEGSGRQLIVAEKYFPTPGLYPRKPGIATKAPLGGE